MDHAGYKKLADFRDLIEDSLRELRAASNQSSLTRAIETLAPRWEPVDPEFHALLRSVGQKAWGLRFNQVQPYAQAIVQHLEGELERVKGELSV